jgi:antitoxin YefM
VARSYVTIILVMETLPLSHVKAHLSEIADRVEDQHDRIVVTRNGRPAAVLVSPEDLESLEETLAVLSDPQLMRQIHESEAELERGDEGVSLEELKAELGSRDAAA